MTKEMIRVKSSSYTRYEDLLLKRDKLRKEAFQYQQSYVREFGQLILEAFYQKLECIRKKKTIEFCQAAKNRGRAVDPDALMQYLDKELAGMRKQLDVMAKEYDASKGTVVSESDLLKIRRIYHRLAKRLHPDLNPVMTGSGELQDIWNRIVAAYNCNDLKELEELEVLALGILEKSGGNFGEIEIEGLDDKIERIQKEMRTIQETDPYTYKFVLEDPVALEEKRDQLQKEFEEYSRYSAELDDVISGMGIEQGDISWRIN